MPLAALSVLGAAVFAAITTEVLPVGLLPVMSSDLGVSRSSVGLLVSAYAVVVAAASVPLTALVSRWPRREVLTVLLCTYAASNAALAATSDYAVALGARVLAAAAHAGFFSVVIAAAIDLVPASRAGRAVTVVSAGNALALAVGVPVGAAVGAAVGWRWAFAGAGALLAVLAGVTATVLPRAPAPAASGHEPVLRAVRRPALVRVALTVAVLTLGHYTLYTYVSPLLLHAGVGRGRVSLALFGYGAAGVVGLVAAGAVVDRHLRRALLTAVSLTTASLLALGLFGTAAPAAVAAVAVWGLGFGAVPTLLQTAALRASPRAPDAAPAVVNATFNVGIAGGALIGSRELLVASPPVLALTAAPLAAAALLLLLVPPLRPRAASASR